MTMKNEPWTVDFYDPLSGKWGRRTLRNEKSAGVYMDGITELLKQSGVEQPDVVMYPQEGPRDTPDPRQIHMFQEVRP